MSTYPSLAGLMQDHAYLDQGRECGGCLWRSWTKDGEPNGCWEEHIEAVWNAACTITTVEQLDALRSDPAGCEGAIIKDSNGEIWEAEYDGSWMRMATQGWHDKSRIELPALLVWSPEWQKP